MKNGKGDRWIGLALGLGLGLAFIFRDGVNSHVGVLSALVWSICLALFALALGLDQKI